MSASHRADRPLSWGFPAEQSVSVWEERHSRGEVPSVWPYGLDGVREFAPVHVLDLPAPDRLARLRARAGLGPRSRVGLAFTWDENAAFRLQVTRPHERFVSGVIWLTDLIERGAVPARLIEVLRRAEALWVLSEAQVEPLRELFGARGPRVVAVPFGVDAEFFSPRPYPAQPRIVSIGNDRDRDPQTLFRALALVREARPDVELVVQTSASGAPDGVEVVQRMTHRELRELYGTASVVATATRPNLHVSGMTVTLEALATGRPVVNTDTPGMGQYVAEGRTGNLVPVGDADAMARRLIALLDDPAGAEAMGRDGRRVVEESFRTQVMCAHLSTLLLSVAE
ncbi:glycosyltransferase family 4 protein [Microbacterium sp. SA39]|uniref:glycosyltransferase family 4 protein n=1 Tax=Microbacterium sp. SA39 TaxID=1263625 RepID=UPI0005FA6C90|nr:glycosyltransferase family 4 protein [Microbacterium sp. SA39]